MTTSEPSPKRCRTGCEDEPVAAFTLMAMEDAERLTLAYAQTDDFGVALRKVLDDHGAAIVRGVLSADECARFQELKEQESTADSTQAGQMQHAQGELAWTARLHPRVRELFSHAFGTTDLSSSADLPSMFYTPEGTPAEMQNPQWLHVDQNLHTGLKHKCYQGVLYIREAGADCSTTALWPGSHLPAVYDQILEDPRSKEKGLIEDAAGVRFGNFLSLNGLANQCLKDELLPLALDGTQRLRLPAGSVLLWDSRTLHQGWRGGPRLAVPVCWEPRDRVPESATLRKLFLTAAGVATSHSPSEGRVHPNASTRRGASAKLRKPIVRPYAALPESELSQAAWEALWAQWPEEAYAENLTGILSKEDLVRVLRPEVVSVV